MLPIGNIDWVVFSFIH